MAKLFRRKDMILDALLPILCFIVILEIWFAIWRIGEQALKGLSK